MKRIQESKKAKLKFDDMEVIYSIFLVLYLKLEDA